MLKRHFSERDGGIEVGMQDSAESLDNGGISTEVLMRMTGIDVGPLTIKFLPDGKILLLSRDGGGAHVTIHPGESSGEADLHSTSATGRHGTLYSIRHDDIAGAMEAIRSELESSGIVALFLKGLRPLRVDWLKVRRVGIARDAFPSVERLSAISTRRHGRLRIDQTTLLGSLAVPQAFDEIAVLPDGAHLLIPMRRPRIRIVGYMFKWTRDGVPIAYWIKAVRYERFCQALSTVVGRTGRRFVTRHCRRQPISLTNQASVQAACRMHYSALY